MGSRCRRRTQGQFRELSERCSLGRLTILTPTIQRALGVLQRCLVSVDRQTLADWVHIICSDGTLEPAVAELVHRGGDDRRSYRHLATPAGHFGAGVRAALLGLVHTEYVAFLDDDNVLFPRYAERMVHALDSHPEAAFAICPILHGGPLLPSFGTPPVVLTGIPPVTNHIDTLQVVVRTQAMQASGWVLAGYASDGATYERLAQTYLWVAVDEVLAAHL